ncbi:MAG TPA: asparagine synthase (glutamine-hydrolyzing) [Pyrinomonadaceae bacterium]|nr:asparagine synthase (glutamine-hydrolyzing) [Pyrinomonadaceae bacterium]
MCGIAGFVESKNRVAPEEASAILDRMCRVIAHRGPDDQGTMHTSEGVHFGMRRLSIIDLAGGHQPISNEDGQVSIVFNGEIYNYRELYPELQKRGHHFKTHSDTEAIVHAYEEFGVDCLLPLRGMFAFAIWDANKKRLFIARDRVGKKPLYYTLTDDSTLIFGSELKSLLQHPKTRRVINPEAVDAYLTCGYVPDPLTILQSVHKLPPGHFLTFENGRIDVRAYWDFQYGQPEAQTPLKEEDYLDELRSLLAESVKLRLIADVPLGAFLSGGIDSSSVVGLMSQQMSQPVKTFSIGFKEDSYNELKYARVAAKHFQTDHHEFVVTPDLCEIVDELAWFLDEPFADSSAIPTYMVSKMARQFVTVVLSGDGGDELFGGYTRYVIDRQRSTFGQLPRFLRRGVMAPLSKQLPHGARGRNFLHNIALDPLDRYLDSISIFTELNKPRLYTNEFVGQLGSENNVLQSWRTYAGNVRTGQDLDKMLYVDSKTYLPGDILTKVDRMSMANSLEARVPLLDHKLIEFVNRIPAGLKLKGLETKYIFKKAIESFVPGEILHRPKQGFGVPVQEWINRQLRGKIRETLTEKRTIERGYINRQYVELLLDEHERARRDHSTQLWTLFMLELWHRSVFEYTPDLDNRIAPEVVEVG